MSKLGFQLLTFKALMDATIEHLGSDDNDELYGSSFELNMKTPSGKSAVIDLDMGASVWELIEDFVSDYAELLADDYMCFEGSELKEISQAFNLDWKEIQSEYNKETETTYIWELEYHKGEISSRNLVGWYFGEPDDDATKKYIGSLKAEF